MPPNRNTVPNSNRLRHPPSLRSPSFPSSPSSRQKFNSVLFIFGFVLLVITSILPLILVHTQITDHNGGDVGIISAHLRQSVASGRKRGKDGNSLEESKISGGESLNMKEELFENKTQKEVNEKQDGDSAQSNEKPNAKRQPPQLSSSSKEEEANLARGVAGLPMSETPALKGARRGKIECDVDANYLAYWNEPQGLRDREFQSPFAVVANEDNNVEKYLSFEPDSGGWNNMRMCLENMFIIAAATNRTLVLPPEQSLYLLTLDKSKQHRGFADFYPVHTPYFQKRLRVISTEEFLRREGGKDGRLPIHEDMKERVMKGQKVCERRAKSEISCFAVYDHFRSVGYVPDLNGMKSCLVFDEDAYHGKEMTTEHSKEAEEFCLKGRKVELYTATMQNSTLIHFRTSGPEDRILNHFYGFIHFTDPAIDNLYKRFVRDYMHYTDPIFCAASKIIHSLQKEGKERGFAADQEGGGGYSSLHVRRGDLQFIVVKIPAEEWYENTKDLWKENEILYIATDEKNKTFFDPIKEHHSIRFLNDYWDEAGLDNLDPNYMGMVDTIVASRGRIFAGTYFSTFTGFITRMRGYHGISMKDAYYGQKDYKTILHKWEDHAGDEFASEWPNGWIGIDGDVVPSRDKF